MEKVVFTTVHPVTGTLCEEFSAIAHHTYGARCQQTSACEYLRECKDETGKTTLREIFFFAESKVKIFRYHEGKEMEAEIKSLHDYPDRSSLAEIYGVFAAHHYSWDLPGQIAPLNLD